MKKIYLDERELQDRIERNYKRLSDSSYYQIGEVFSPESYDWYGDKEGRALLAFVSHYKINKRKIDCMDEMIEVLKAKSKEGRYHLGPTFTDIIHEQTLSGHSWFLRGLCEYYEQFRDEYALCAVKGVVDEVYMPTRGKYCTYSTDRSQTLAGGVSGNSDSQQGSWILSTDVGCAFMSIDGLSHAYKLTKDEKLKELIDEMIRVYLGIDKFSLKVQTHCTLTAARGMMRMYSLTKDIFYLNGAVDIWVLYTEKGGMTYTYQNANWWDRNDTWTEPCAIVDSLMLGCELYFATKEDKYRRTAARIFHNGFATLQRFNGGAGTDSVVTGQRGGADTLCMLMYEAYFCCTMRLSEGLWYVSTVKDILYAETSGNVTKDERGVYSDNDIIYASQVGEGIEYAYEKVSVDGLTLTPIIKYYNIPDEVMGKIKQKIIHN